MDQNSDGARQISHQSNHGGGAHLFEDATVIALAIETDAEIVLSDDAMVRARALVEGFQVTGTLGMLLRVKNDGFIESVREKIEILEAAGFRIHPRLKTQILQTAGEW